MLIDLLCGPQNVLSSKEFNVENLKMVNMLNTHVNRCWMGEGKPLTCNTNVAAVVVNSNTYRLVPIGLAPLTCVHSFIFPPPRGLDRYCSYPHLTDEETEA